MRVSNFFARRNADNTASPEEMPKIWPHLTPMFALLAWAGLAASMGSSPGGASAISSPEEMPKIWPHLDLNQGPTGYEPAALTN